jgi:hypothetical protein
VAAALVLKEVEEVMKMEEEEEEVPSLGAVVVEAATCCSFDAPEMKKDREVAAIKASRRRACLSALPFSTRYKY